MRGEARPSCGPACGAARVQCAEDCAAAPVPYDVAAHSREPLPSRTQAVAARRGEREKRRAWQRLSEARELSGLSAVRALRGMTPARRGVACVLLLCCSNTFMTTAWCGRLAPARDQNVTAWR